MLGVPYRQGHRSRRWLFVGCNSWKMNRKEFEALPEFGRMELAEHLQRLRERRNNLYPDEKVFKEELEEIERELGTLFPQ